MTSNESSPYCSIGNWDNNVFIAGDLYFRSRLQEIANAVIDCGFKPQNTRYIWFFGSHRTGTPLSLLLKNVVYAIF